jgi:hypothetical protein
LTTLPNRHDVDGKAWPEIHSGVSDLFVSSACRYKDGDIDARFVESTGSGQAWRARIARSTLEHGFKFAASR